MKQLKITGWIEAYINRATSLRFQIILSIITSVILTYLLYNSFYRFKTFDPKPELYPYTQEQLDKKPAEVNTGLFIHSFPTFNPTKNTFTLDGIIWYMFDPEKTSIKTIQDFSFEKAIQVKKSAPDIDKINGKIMAKFPVLVEFTSDLDYRFFPFDDHRISIVLTNRKVSPDKIIFTSKKENFQLEDNLYTGGLVFFDHSVEYGFSQSDLIAGDSKAIIENPRVIFSLDFRKYGLRRMILIIIPIILIFFLAIFSLSLDPSQQMRDILTLSVGSLTTLLTYRFVIETLSPSVGYFTLTDYLYTFVLSCTFLVFLFGAFSIRTKELSYHFKRLRVSLILLLHVSLIIFVYFLLN